MKAQLSITYCVIVCSLILYTGGKPLPNGDHYFKWHKNPEMAQELAKEPIKVIDVNQVDEASTLAYSHYLASMRLAGNNAEGLLKILSFFGYIPEANTQTEVHCD